VIELIDSHAHVDGPEFDGDRAAVLARARAAGVRRMIVIGAVGDPGSATRAVAMAEADPDVFATIATHPHDVDKLTPAWWEVHERLAPTRASSRSARPASTSITTTPTAPRRPRRSTASSTWPAGSASR
jgi:Tat protein secretion system quality control protein TatD with DNase activity